METINKIKRNLGKAAVLLAAMMWVFTVPSFAHCDSYDGPVIQDAYKALDQEDVSYILKWILEDQEAEITSLFGKTVNLKHGDAEVYRIVEKHFLETLVRLHRETEGGTLHRIKTGGFYGSHSRNGRQFDRKPGGTNLTYEPGQAYSESDYRKI